MMAITESNLQSVSRKDRHQRKVTNEWNFIYNRSRVSQKIISPKYLSQNICSIFIFFNHIYDLRDFILVITRFQNLFITHSKVYSQIIHINVFHYPSGYLNPKFWSAILRSHLWISLQKRTPSDCPEREGLILLGIFCRREILCFVFLHLLRGRTRSYRVYFDILVEIYCDRNQ